MGDVILVSRSHQLHKALQSNSVYNQPFVPPAVITKLPGADGLWIAGSNGEVSPYRVKIFPYCDGEPGSRFLLRLYAYDHLRDEPAINPSGAWLGAGLAELQCTAGAIPGPQGPTNPGRLPLSVITPSENFCDGITLTKGSLGLKGEIVTFGTGSGVIAFAQVEIRGPRFIYFDFSQIDPVGMNCLWTRT